MRNVELGLRQLLGQFQVDGLVISEGAYGTLELFNLVLEFAVFQKYKLIFLPVLFIILSKTLLILVQLAPILLLERIQMFNHQLV